MAIHLDGYAERQVKYFCSPTERITFAYWHMVKGETC
jgi:hypothetical protein